MSGAVILGAGPGLGTAVARRVARGGLAVGVIARTEATVDDALTALSDYDAFGVAADVTDEAGLRAALDEIVDRFGVPELLVYNAALIRRDGIGELTADQHLAAWAVNVVGAITAVAHLAPRMAQRGTGTIIMTSGMPEPLPEATSLSLGKAGVRALAALLAKAYGSAGLHVATVTIDGAVAAGTAFDPDDIAEHYWRLHTQPPGAWEHDVVHTGLPSRPPAAGTDGGQPQSAANGRAIVSGGTGESVMVLLVSGSNRDGSTNTAVLRTAAALAPTGIESTLLEGLGELPLFNPDDDSEGHAVHPAVAAMRSQVARADAILICTPEYAGALPALIKNALEWTIGDAGTYGKPVAWINASGPAAPTGASDAHESLVKVLAYAGADVVPGACARIPISRSMVDEEGLISDPQIGAQIAAALEQLARYAISR
jgi:NAD(P)H-dependent FMN reductase/NAD(P)-dependent dehydrogenase (short-subunit alcohol dehydrogenase family)